MLRAEKYFTAPVVWYNVVHYTAAPPLCRYLLFLRRGLFSLTLQLKFGGAERELPGGADPVM